MLLTHGARSTLWHAKRQGTAGPTARVGAEDPGDTRTQQGDVCVGEQAGANRLGGMGERRGLRGNDDLEGGPTDGCLDQTS